MELDPLEKAVVCVAGAVAVLLLEDEEILADEIIHYWQDDEIGLSDTDYSGIPDGWEDREAAVQAALDILRRHRKLLDAVVSELEAHEEITYSDVDVLVERFAPDLPPQGPLA